MLRGIVLVLIDTQDDGEVFVGGRRRDDHLLHRPAQMLACQLRLGELARRFDDHLRAHRLPIQLGRIFLREDLDPLSPEIVGDTGYAYLAARQYDDSILQCKKAIDLEPSAMWLHAILAWAYARKGDFAKAVEWQNRSMADPQRAQDDDAQARLKLYRARRPWPPGS